jgi:geranylgeranyl pyrophosphate synthase
MDINIFYIAVIVVLIICIVYFYAKYQYAKSTIADIEEKIGVGDINYVSIQRKDNKPLREFNKDAIAKEKTYAEYRSEVGKLISNAIEYGDFGKTNKLTDACKSALTGGKYLRSIILLETSRCCIKNSVVSEVAEAALFLEYIHAASLIIDDLPEFDNDDIRRDKPSLHSEFGKNTAQLAGISLVSTAFSNMGRQIDWIRYNRPDIKNVDRLCTKIVNMTFEAIGPNGLAGGQFLDISATELQDDIDKYVELMHKKTAVLFELAFCLGWILSGGSYKKLQLVQEIGRSIGIAFQISDDIQDMTTDYEQAEKQNRADWNFANKYGIRIALIEFNKYKNGAILLMKQLDLYSTIWDKELFPMITPAADKST